MTDDAWRGTGGNAKLQLVRIPRPVLDALAAGQDTSTLPGGSDVTPYLAEAQHTGLWRRRSAQLKAHPDDAPWVTRFIVVDGVAGAVGVAGFHGAPDANGMVEVGYRVDPAHRRRGYARGALETLLAVARADRRVRTVRATIAPDNLASRALVDQYRFTAVGEQWDDEDGLEIILEVDA